jgi:hypothetical protein
VCPGEALVTGCKTDGVLEERKGIEVGHCFYLGTKYSEPMEATYVQVTRSPRAPPAQAFHVIDFKIKIEYPSLLRWDATVSE